MSNPPFQKQENLDKAGIIGARWWQESLASDVPRRQAVIGLAALGGFLAATAALGTCMAHRSSTSTSGASSGAPDVDFQPRSALAMQRQYGWNFGAADEPLVFDGKSTKPFDRAALARLGTDLAPASSAWAPFFVPTLFESVSAQPTAKLSDDATTFIPLRDALVPISTPATETAFKQGRALASLLANAPQAKDLAVIVDLPGPEAVAFAAGAANVLDPVFLFDNWPHPRGVVPAHLTLASAVYYQPLFLVGRAGNSAKSKRPLFVVDRHRIAAYTDDATQFDNRHVERLPSAKSLAAAGVRNVLYVGPNAVQRQELDDMVDDFVSYASGSPPILIHSVPATAFEPAAPGADAGDGDTYYYGSSPTVNRTFWTHWSSPPSHLSTNDLELYAPTPRVSAFSSGSGVSARPRPAGFGMIPVAVAVGTGLVLGAKLNRNGSWNRTSSSSSWSSGS